MTFEPRQPRPRRRLRHSLGGRLLLVFVLLATLSTLILVGGVRQILGQGWERWLQPLTADYLDRVVQDLGSPPQIERARALTERLPLDIAIRGPQVNWSSRQDAAPLGRSFDPWLNRHSSWAEHMSRRTVDGHEVRVSLSAKVWSEHPSRKAWWMLLALLLVTALAYACVRWMLRPLRSMAEGADAFGRGEFEHRIASPGRRRHLDELGDLALRFNLMAAEIQQMLDGKRALLLAISHELRSPLTRVRLNTELVDASPAQQAILQDLALMRDLIQDLLESERLGQGHKALDLQTCDLNALLRQLLQAQFAAAPIEASLAPDLAPLRLDAMRIQLLARNLLDNALRHNRPELGPVRLSTARTEQGLILRVRDHGLGVDAAVLAQLGEPFFRSDAARSRADGGAGLGLHLCRLIAQAHGGELLFSSQSPGLEVMLRLPLSPAIKNAK